MGSLIISLVSEFIGTFILVTAGASVAAAATLNSTTVPDGGLVTIQNVTLVGLTFGMVLIVLIYALAAYSGAHFNPAVSLGVCMDGKIQPYEMLLYWIAQVVGGLLAALFLYYFYPKSSNYGATIGYITNTDPVKAMVVEALFTFIFVLSILFIINSSSFNIFLSVNLSININSTI